MKLIHKNTDNLKEIWKKKFTPFSKIEFYYGIRRKKLKKNSFSKNKLTPFYLPSFDLIRNSFISLIFHLGTSILKKSNNHCNVNCNVQQIPWISSYFKLLSYCKVPRNFCYNLLLLHTYREVRSSTRSYVPYLFVGWFVLSLA